MYNTASLKIYANGPSYTMRATMSNLLGQFEKISISTISVIYGGIALSN